MTPLLRYQSELHRQGYGMTANQYHHVRLHGSASLGTTEPSNRAVPTDKMGTSPHGESKPVNLGISGDRVATKTKTKTK